MIRARLSRRRLLALGALAALAPWAGAQTPRRVKIGMLDPSPFESSLYSPGVVQGFAELGYATGAGATFEHRFAEGNGELMHKRAEDLIALDCDLLVAVRTLAPVRALQALRPAAPILFLAIDYDPLSQGVVNSLRRPDRNTTGVYVGQNGLVGRRVELMRELLPQANRLIVFADPFSADQVEAARKAAAAANLQLMLVQFQATPYNYASYLQDAQRVGDAFMTLASPIFARDRERIREVVARARLPSIGTNPLQAEVGYLMSLGSNIPKVTRRAADMGVRLLSGAKTADMPVQRAEEFELIINTSTARALGVKIPDSLLARATRVIP